MTAPHPFLSSPGTTTSAFFATTIIFLAVLCLDPAHAEIFAALAAVMGGAALYARRALRLLWSEPLVWLIVGFGIFSALVLLFKGNTIRHTGVIYGWIVPLIIGKALAYLRGPKLHHDLLWGAIVLSALLAIFFALPILGLPELGDVRFGTAELTYTFRNQTRTALFVSLAALIALTHFNAPRRFAISALASCGILLPALVLAGKRMTVAALVTSATLFALVKYRLHPRTLGIAAALLLILGGLIVMLDDTQRFDLHPDRLLASQGIQERATVWYAALELFHSAPFTGTGFRTFRDAAAPFVAEYRSAHPGFHEYENLNDAHNIVLHLLAESGLTGLGIFTAIFVLPMRRAWSLRAAHPAALCLGGCVVLIVLNFQLHMHLLAYNVSALVFFILGMAQGLEATEDAPPC